MKQLRNLLRPKFLVSGFVAALIIAAGIVTGPNHAQATACPGKDDDTNAIIRCGYNTLNELGTKIANDPYKDVSKIYNHFAKGTFDINYFKQNAVHVTMYKKTGETKTDDGTVVATSTKSLGREKHGGNRQTYNISGVGTYYYSPIQDSFGADTLDGYALMNPDDHSMLFVSMKACGNPAWGTSPKDKCDVLKQTKVSETEYKYSVASVAKDGATVKKVVIDFGDGESVTLTSDFTQEVTHKYTKYGKFTARATVYFNVHGKEKSDTRVSCTKPVDIPQPPKPVYYCTGLIAKAVPGSRTKFVFTASAFVKNGAVLQSATFKFDDGKTKTVPAQGTSATTEYEYTKVGVHTTTVDLKFNVGNDNGNYNCFVKTKTTEETCKDTPNKPECQTCESHPNRPECKTPCELNPELPECKPPKDCVTNPEMEQCTKIPETGPAEVFGTVLGLSAITGAAVYYRGSRRNLLGNIFKR